MVNLPGTAPEMVAADFKGVAEALKGRNTIFVYIFWGEGAEAAGFFNALKHRRCCFYDT